MYRHRGRTPTALSPFNSLAPLWKPRGMLFLCSTTEVSSVAQTCSRWVCCRMSRAIFATSSHIARAQALAFGAAAVFLGRPPFWGAVHSVRAHGVWKRMHTVCASSSRQPHRGRPAWRRCSLSSAPSLCRRFSLVAAPTSRRSRTHMVGWHVWAPCGASHTSWLPSRNHVDTIPCPSAMLNMAKRSFRSKL